MKINMIDEELLKDQKSIIEHLKFYGSVDDFAFIKNCDILVIDINLTNQTSISKTLHSRFFNGISSYIKVMFKKLLMKNKFMKNGTITIIKNWVFKSYHSNPLISYFINLILKKQYVSPKYICLIWRKKHINNERYFDIYLKNFFKNVMHRHLKNKMCLIVGNNPNEEDESEDKIIKVYKEVINERYLYANKQFYIIGK